MYTSSNLSVVFTARFEEIFLMNVVESILFPPVDLFPS